VGHGTTFAPVSKKDTKRNLKQIESVTEGFLEIATPYEIKD
jgi:hypothetical protein